MSAVAQKIYLLGERGSGFKSRGELQDFYKIRDECLRTGKLFEDPLFPASDKSICLKKTNAQTWKRPKDIVKNPHFIVDDVSRFDLVQGQLGDCWLIAALANITANETIFSRVIPNDQSFVNKYAGIFHFRFWQYGRWVDVVVDDRLPTTSRGNLAFLSSAQQNEFWGALLEKAYAKLHRSYGALESGLTKDAMEDFTGGVSEDFALNECPIDVYQLLQKAHERMSLMGCSIMTDGAAQESELDNGLVVGHAYSITNVSKLSNGTTLVRVRNPWGNGKEWTGPWSDISSEWDGISEKERDAIKLTVRPDGEFWMSCKDFQRSFSYLEICNLTPNQILEDNIRNNQEKCWDVSVYEGEWVKGINSGGCLNYLESFHLNPQYLVTLTDVDESDDDELCTIIVGLMQKHRRTITKQNLAIGYYIYKPTEERPDVVKPLGAEFFKYNYPEFKPKSFEYAREVCNRHRLRPGTYCIIPTAFDPKDEAEFILRVFSEKENLMKPNEEQVDFIETDDRVQWSGDQEHTAEMARKMFLEIAGEDEEVDWAELKDILNSRLSDQIKGVKFSSDMCRSMISMMDADLSGKLGFEEYLTLVGDINTWQTVFELYDVDGSGNLNVTELRAALLSAGYVLNSRILSILVHRYATKDGQVEFSDFITCAIRLKTMIEMFKERRITDGYARFNLDEWLERTMYS